MARNACVTEFRFLFSIGDSVTVDDQQIGRVTRLSTRGGDHRMYEVSWITNGSAQHGDFEEWRLAATVSTPAGFHAG